MNIEDISSDVIPTDFSQYDRLDYIFQRQHALMARYIDIERNNGLLYTEDVPVNLDDRFGQARLKDFFWRVTEELTEATDAARVHAHIPNHTYEELADALHFLVEACILSGIESEDLNLVPDLGYDDKLEGLVSGSSSPQLKLEQLVYEVIHHIGCASNCLKQRPWKVTHQLTDRPKFYDNLKQAMFKLCMTFDSLGFTANQVFQMYWKKSEVNKFRIRSNY